MAGGSEPAVLRAEMRALVADAHTTKGRDAQSVPYVAHAFNVGDIVDLALAASGELSDDPAYALDLYLAAVGHDLYRTTTVSRARVRERFGARVDSMLACIADRHGDVAPDDTRAEAPGAAGPAGTDDGVRLIKLADLVVNVTGCAYGVRELGVPWARDTFLPLALWMFRLVSTTDPARFALTAALLLGWLDLALDRLRGYLAIARAVDTADPAAVADAAARAWSDWDSALGGASGVASIGRTLEREWREGALVSGGHLFLPSGSGSGGSTPVGGQ